MAEDPLAKYGRLVGWEWRQPKPRKPRRPRGQEPGGYGRAQAKAAAAGFSSVEEWEAAGWPHPIDPETGSSYEGYKIARMEGGLHPDGRKMDDQDWFNPRTQQIFDYLAQARVYSSHYDWADEMRTKYPNYPMPGINMQDLLRQMFPDWYDGEEAPAAPVAREVPLPTHETFESMIPEAARDWMVRLGMEVPERVARPPEDRALPVGQMPEREREKLRRAIGEGEIDRRLRGIDWEAYMKAEERKPTTWRDYLRGEEPTPEEAPVEPARPAWEGVGDLIERAKEILSRPEITEPIIRPEVVAAAKESVLENLPNIWAAAVEARKLMSAGAFPWATQIERARPGTIEEVVAGSLLPAEWIEYAIGQGMMRTLAVKRVGEPPERWKDDPKTIAEYELGNLLASLDDATREKMINSLARIAWSTPEHHRNAAIRLIDPTEYEGWALYEGELVQIEPGIPLKEGYAPVEMWDPDVVTQILRQEEWVLSEFFFRSLIDPLKLFYIPEVQQAPGAFWRRLTGKRTPAQYGRKIFTAYYGPGEEVPEYIEEFLRSSKGKPAWWQKAFVDNLTDWFNPLTSRYAAWKARGAPAVIMSLPDQVGDFTSYMRAAAKAEGEVRRSYALVYPRAGTSDPNFLQVIAKAMTGGLNPAQLREMRVLVIEAENYRAMGNMEGAAEKVAALEKMAKQGIPLGQRWRLVAKLARTKAGSMALNRDTPATSREIMADNAIRVLGWLFEDMPSGIDRAVTALLLKKDPGALLNETKMRFLNSLGGLDTFMLLQHIRDDSLGSMVHATGIPSTNIQGGWTALHNSLRRIAGTYYYPTPRPDPWQRMIGWFYRLAPRTYLSTPRYPIQNIVSNFTNIWARYGWVTPRTDASSLEWINRFTGDAGFLPPGFARSITAAGEVSTERIPTLLGRKWVYEGPTERRREALSEEAVAVARELGGGPSPVGWAKRLVKKGGQFLPLQEGWIDLSKWGERNSSMANYRDMVDTIKGLFGRPRRGFLDGVPERIEPSAAMRAASDEIVASSLAWNEIVERHAELYGYEKVPDAARYVSTERIRLLGPEAHEVADDLEAALAGSGGRKTNFSRRYRLVKDGIEKQVQEWVKAEPDFPEEVELEPTPLEGLSPEEVQRLMALTGVFQRNQRHLTQGWQLLTELARKAGMPIEEANRIAVLALDKAWTAYGSYGLEVKKIYAEYASLKKTYGGQIWPVYEARREALVARTHEAFDKVIVDTAERLGGDVAEIREALALRPWSRAPADLMARRLQDLQDDIINAVHTIQSIELPLAPEGVEVPDDLESLISIRRWVEEKDLAAQAWLEYMREAIKEKQIAEAAEKVVRLPAEVIKRARRASWTEGTARRIELMEQKITRLQNDIATSPVEAADVEQLTRRQQELYGMAMELEGIKDTLTSLPTQKEVFRFWDYKEGNFRKVKDPSGRVVDFAKSEIVQEIAYKHYGLEHGLQGAETLGEMIRQRLDASNRIAELENLIWEDPELILPETAETLEAFIRDSEPQLDQMMLYEREPYLFESGLQHYEQAVDKLAKIRAGEAMPESVASSIKSAKEEIARLEREREAIRMEALERNRIPASAEEQVMLAQDLQALNEQYVAKGIVKRNRLGQGPLFEDLEELRERGFFKRTVRGPRKADKARAIPKIGYQHYFYTLTDQGHDAVKGISVVRLEEVPKPVPPGSQWVEPVGVPEAEAGPPVTAAEQAALFGPPEAVGMPKPEVPKPQLPGLEAGELFGGGEIPMEIPLEARERLPELPMDIEGLTPEAAEKIAMEEGAHRLPGVEPLERAISQEQFDDIRERIANMWQVLRGKPEVEGLRMQFQDFQSFIERPIGEAAWNQWERFVASVAEEEAKPVMARRLEAAGLTPKEIPAPEAAPEDKMVAQAREGLAKYWKWPEEYIARLSPEEIIEAEAKQLRHYDQPPYAWLDRFNTKDDLVRDAIEHWGLTDDLAEAGYILEDGSLLDFSGKKEGGTPGMRSLDHREVTRVIEGDWPELGGSHALGYFETRANAIRIMPPMTLFRGLAAADLSKETFIFTLMEGQEVTEAQRQVLRKYVGQKPGAIYVEIYDSSGSLAAKETVEMPRVSDVDRVIDTLFEGVAAPREGRIERIEQRVTEARTRLEEKRGEWDAEEIKASEDQIAFLEGQLRGAEPEPKVGEIRRTMLAGPYTNQAIFLSWKQADLERLGRIERGLERGGYDRAISRTAQQARKEADALRKLLAERLGKPEAEISNLAREVAEDVSAQMKGAKDEERRLVDNVGIEAVAPEVPKVKTADEILEEINNTHARLQGLRGTGQEAELAAAQADLARLGGEFKAAGGMEAVTLEEPFKVGQEVIVTKGKLIPPHINLSEGDRVTVTGVHSEMDLKGYISVDKKYVDGFFDPKAFGPVTEPIEPRVEEGISLKGFTVKRDAIDQIIRDWPEAATYELGNILIGHIEKKVGTLTEAEKGIVRRYLKDIRPTVAPKPELPKPAEALRQVGALPAYEKPEGVPTMLTNAHREALRALGYSDAMIGQMTPEQGLALIEGRLKDFVPTIDTPMGPMGDLDVVMPPSPREGAELKRDLLLERMDEWYKDALKEYGKPVEGDPTNFENVNRWLEDELRGQWAQLKIYMDKMGEAATDWTLHSYRKKNIDTLMYRAFFWPYWQTRTGYKWAKTFLENPSKLADWARWHDTHQKINEDLPENFRDSVHIPDWIPVIGGQYWNAYWFFDPIYPWLYGLEDLMPALRKQGWRALLGLFPRKLPVSPLIGMSEAMEPMITEEGRRVEPLTPWSRAVYEKFGINVEAAMVKALETGYSEVKPSIYRGLERGGRAIGRPGLAERALGGPEVIPVIPEGRYEPYHISMRIIDMWIAGSITEDEMLDAMQEREGRIWEAAYSLTRQGRGTTEFTSIATGIRPRELLPAHYEIEGFKRRRGMLRTMEEGPEKRAFREQIYEDYPFARQWDVRYDSAETARMEGTISDAWQDIENQAVISDKKLADAIRSRPGDLAYEYEVKQENRQRAEQRRAFWQRQGVSFVFNPRTRTFEEIEEWVQNRIIGQFYYHLPQAERFKDEEGAIDWDAYNEAVEAFWEDLPRSIVKWEDIVQMDQEVSDAIGTKVNVLSLAQEVATEEAYDEWRKANDIPEEALNYTWKKYIIDVANEYYQEELKDLEYDERNMPAFFSEFGHKTAEDLIPYILQEYPDRWTEEELTERLGVTEGPVLSFLREGKASHPDELEPRQEYDAMIRALTAGVDIPGALEVAMSHLQAHQNALGRGRDTVQDPYPGEPEKNQAAVEGFEQVVQALQAGQQLAAGITMPGIWEQWNQDGDERSTAISLLWAFWGGQTGLGRRRMKELLNSTIYNQYFVDKEGRNYERITNEELEGWLKELNVPNPWDDNDGALRTLYYWTVDSTGDPLLYKDEEPEARGGRPPGMAMPAAEPPTPEEEEPAPEPLRTIPQLAGTSESAQYAQAQDEMAAWVAGGKEGDWTPLMEQWFGKDTPAGFFWEYYWEEIPPGRIADDLRGDPIIEMLLNKAFRTVYDVKEGAYEAALETMQTWKEAHPEVPGDPKEWAIVRQIVKKYWELREAGAQNEARAIWMYFATLLEPYYPSKPAPKRRGIPAYMRRGRGGGGRGRKRGAFLTRWRRWVNIRYFPTR